MMRAGHLPVSVPVGNFAKKERYWASRSRMFPLSERWIHAIPLIVLLSFFILWCSSRPVNVEIKDGKIVAIHQVEMQLPLNNNSQIELTILASATSPIASAPKNFTLTATATPTGNETTALTAEPAINTTE